jgi:hypothetical protein
MTKRSLVIHPFALAVYPILALEATNLQQLPIALALRSFVIALVGTTLILIIFWRLTGSWTKAGLLTSLILVLFFAYGQVYDLAKNLELAGVTIGRHRYLTAIWLILLLGLGSLVWRRSEAGLMGLTQFMNAASLVAVALPIASMIRLSYLSSLPLQETQASNPESALGWTGVGQPPDIYYIILDSYAREDVLQDIYGFDNHAFIQALRDRGFYVADHSQANHVSTAFSLASSLNMSTLPDLGIVLPPGTYPAPLTDPIRNSQVRKNLEGLGYITVALSSGWAPTSIINAAVYMSPDSGGAPGGLIGWLQPNSFESFLLSTTWLRFPLDVLEGQRLTSFAASLDAIEGNEAQRQLVLWTFDTLEHTPQLQSPKFVFAHFVSPHRPYLFGPNGERTPASGALNFEDTGPGTNSIQEFNEYRDQLLYINKRTLEMLDILISQSKQPPIIILQSDTGPAFGFDWAHPDERNLRTKIGILNAYLLPGDCDSLLYPTISPINSFRVVFDCVFNGQYALKADQTYYSDHHNPNGYVFTPIEDLLAPTPEAP